MHMTTNDLHLAHTLVRDNGGWLLDLGDGHYLATDDEDAVRNLRGPAFLAHSQQTGEWDETVSLPRRGGNSRHRPTRTLPAIFS